MKSSLQTLQLKPVPKLGVSKHLDITPNGKKMFMLDALREGVLRSIRPYTGKQEGLKTLVGTLLLYIPEKRDLEKDENMVQKDRV